MGMPPMPPHPPERRPPRPQFPKNSSKVKFNSNAYLLYLYFISIALQFLRGILHVGRKLVNDVAFILSEHRGSLALSWSMYPT